MNEDLLDLINEFQRKKQLHGLDEAATKQGVILRILKYLGWDPFNTDEIYPEYSVGGKRVDYSLRHKSKNKVFIEVKKIDEDLEKHQKQLLDYSFSEGVKLAVLTNGISWWFYLPLNEGSWEERKFYSIEIYDQESEDIVKKFEDFLSRENVISDKAVENAEKVYKNKKKRDLVEKALPKAWEKIITEPDDLLVELLAETAEKLCGYKPDNKIVENFLMNIDKTQVNVSEKVISFARPKNQKISSISSSSYTNQRITSFRFKGKKYPVNSWKNMLIKICEIMFTAHREQFDKVFNLRGRKKLYFTRNRNELREPKEIKGTGIYVETNFSANYIVKISKNVLSLFGYEENDLSIEVE
ncbi:type I restriction endonuclease [Mesoaciditoga lauensis]|uniref:type I restriction endonuclease n=1 Tax=Mesoaciditoga lauensis TaxID=1495039 RepID=UPI00055A46BE|nr:restriction endonuclease subunit R [Mesoaciditoga lauensis]